MKPLIVYYSYGGNTRKIAQMIQQKTGGDLLEIETVQPYIGSYQEVVNQGQDEVNRGYMPEIREIGTDISTYGILILGSPVWWYTFSPAMKTFLNQCNLSGKTVFPFATNGGWIGHTFQDFEKACTGAVVKKGLNVRFDETRLTTSEKEIEKWIDGIK